MSAAPDPTGRQRTRKIVWLLVVAAVGVASYVVVEQRRAATAKATSDCEKWKTLLNEALGFLESTPESAPKNALAEAERLLTELSREFPKEPAAVRNLAICKVMQVDPLNHNPSSGVPPVDPATALPAIDAARALEPNSPVPHILAARVAQWMHDDLKAVSELQEAARFAPKDAANWYEIYFLATGAADVEIRNQEFGAIISAVEADPTNSSLLKQRMLHQAENKEKAVVETLETLLKYIEPILPAIQQAMQVDVNEMAKRLTDAVEANNWQVVLFCARQINIWITPDEWVKSDLRRVQKRHPLAFVAPEFSPAVCAGALPFTGSLEPRIDIRFRESNAEGRLPELASVTDIDLSDVDQDGLPDVIAITSAELAVFSRKAPREPWQKSMAVTVRDPMSGLLVADLDRDIIAKLKPVAATEKNPVETKNAPPAKPSCQIADVDVVVFGPAGVQVFRNDLGDDGRRVFVPVEQNEELDALRDVLAGVLADVDHDGDLDLVLSARSGVSIWSNIGQLKFTNISKRSGLPPVDLAATSLVAVDWDRDLDLDILITGQTAGWLENLRHGSLRWRAFEPQLAKLSGSQCLNILEADGHPSWDVVGAGSAGLHLARTTTEPGGIVKSRDVKQISGDTSSRSIVGDFDNDTNPDLLAWGETGLKLYWGLPASRFEAAAAVIEPPPQSVVAVAAADMDGDGDLDLVVAESGRLILYDNQGGNKNHWLAVRSKGDSGDNQNRGDVNHLGIGSVLEIKVGRKYQAQVITGQVTHFGLGKNKSADVLRAIWTTGISQTTPKPEADVELCRLHIIGTSCPYFYTWNGNRFEFCTDACWNAPLGLQLAEGVFAEPRAWEYLTIPPGRLAPKHGKYLIQMTEELWEATYLDRMELLVVDHPADVDIFSNEKVGPAELAEFKIHTVRERRLPVAARDKHGRDVLDVVSHEDGNFMKGFDADPRHGVTDEHYLELDLGLLERPNRITLFLTGWLYPATTSLRVGLSQDKSMAPLRPPALEVPDAHGQWQVVRPFMGFPGGRTKTIAVDLTGAFLTDDYRLRIATNLEFLWDAAFFTVDEDPAPLEVVRLPVASADLHYRGFSAIFPRPGFAPDGYDYNRVSTLPKWAPMAGLFTRYGDVTELLQADDDMQVIFGSGDELTVTFDVPEKGPPPGWKRDFLLHNVGWDKDNDLNVVTSQGVEPLPFHGMSGYPYRADEQYPQTERHRAYLKKYQTRTQQPVSFWRQTQTYRASD
ncbi:MAG: VCBS repeat-containing protein [Planctomycetia bacterium]|nr:VCBS repeat-containing protein [Planctomycetia bacterium]